MAIKLGDTVQIFGPPLETEFPVWTWGSFGTVIGLGSNVLIFEDDTITYFGYARWFPRTSVRPVI
jgi:hypothetical protein